MTRTLFNLSKEWYNRIIGAYAYSPVQKAERSVIPI